MNGATAEPFEKTIKNPMRAMASNIGASQYFFLVSRKRVNSFIKSMGTPKIDLSLNLPVFHFLSNMRYVIYPTSELKYLFSTI